MFRFGDPGGRMYTNVGTGNANLLAWWTTIGSQGTWSVSPNTGVLGPGNSSLRIVQTNGQTPCNLSKTLDARATWGIALHMKMSIMGANTFIVCALTDTGLLQLELRVNADGTLSVTRNGSALTGGTSSFSLSANVYYHLEWKSTIDPSVGATEVRVNGVTRIGPLTGLNTRATSNSSANGFHLGCVNPVSLPGTLTTDFDDVIVWDIQATDANGFADIHDFIGDCGLTWLLPTGAGTTTQFTPDTGVNYARVNEATPDGDTSYVADANIGDIDTYAMADLPVNITAVKSMAVCHFARKNDTNSRSIAAQLRSGGTNYSHATPVSLNSGYLYDFSNWGLNPNTGVAWTVADINAIESGQKVAS
jgi:hypothetical protein